ncbi:MAG: hypothetical protein QOH15_1211 [Gaiellales bacterium]|jgi:hypothetical protein|nr:hypothetical protein [Gaiellales bacterium]
MKRVLPVICAVLVCAAAEAVAVPSALASDRCVGSKHGCYSAIQPAVDAAHDGDVIRIGPGTYAGGVVVDASITLVGAGARSTVIRGGEHVLTVGVPGQSSAPTVSVVGVTITGGVATGDGNITFVGLGGGVLIPGTTTGIGATVTIKNSVIAGNRATPGSTTDSGDPCPGGANCLFAGGFGGGVADLGKLTLINTTVRDNVAGGGLASEADGGGIWTATNGGPGALTLIRSTVTGNTAVVSAPNGRFAQGAGIFVQDGESFTVRNSIISDNSSIVTSSFPGGLDVNANTAGIHIGGLGSASIVNSRVTGNVASAAAPSGTPGANAAALGDGFSDVCVCGQTLVLKNDVIARNRTTASGGGFTIAGSAVEIDGGATISNTAIVGNQISATSAAGDAIAGGALFAIDGEPDALVMRESVVLRNTVEATSSTGTASAQGAGIDNAGLLELHDVQVRDNSASATGPSGSARGGGIWNGRPFAPDGPTPHLVLDDTTVSRNALSASPGLAVEGGGIFTSGFPTTLVDSQIEHNTPDQCVGC